MWWRGLDGEATMTPQVRTEGIVTAEPIRWRTGEGPTGHCLNSNLFRGDNMQRMKLCAAIMVVFAAPFIAASEPTAQPPLPVCHAQFDKLLSDQIFRRYAVHVATGAAKSHAPNVKSGRARLYRTIIKAEAKRGPNFADHFSVIRIGCGAATLCLAIADARTGRVYFPSKLRSVESLRVDTENVDVDSLFYRRSSRLLVAIGSPNENRERAGISYYVWRSNQLKLIRFDAASKVCNLPASTRF